MPRQHTVTAGETLRTIAQRFLGSPNKDSTLLAFNRSRLKGSSVYPGDVLLIPDGFQSPIVAEPGDSDEDQVIFSVGGKSFYNFESVKLTFPIDSVAYSFILEIVLDSENFNIPIIPFGYEKCTISIGNIIVMSGRVEFIRSDISSDGVFLLVQGRSMAGVLVDVSYPGRPVQFTNQNLEQITKLLVQSHGIEPVFLSSPGASFSRATMKQGEQIFTFLSRLANMRGLLATSNADGQLVFLAANFSTKSVAGIVEGEGTFVNARSVYDGTVRYSDISADGQRRTGQATIRESVTDPVLSGVNRPLLIQAESTPEDDLLQAVKWERGKRIAASTMIKVTLDGWKKPEDGLMWQTNQCVDVKIPSCFIKKSTKMLIKNVEFTRDVDGTLTTLDLALPEAFTTETPDKVTPW